jgi:hypothetical protein
MGGAVEGKRQPQHVLEVLAHRGQPTAVRKAIGVQGDQYPRANTPNADQAPQSEQKKDSLPGLVARTHAATGQGIDNAAEQYGAEKGDRSEGDVGKNQCDRKTPFRREQGHHAAVESQEAHPESASPAAGQPVRLRRAISYQSRSVR